ncbi:hypothetical protein K431DRAFT_121186 [Polychaeton citri CBS 116435]|uniref:Uncharacterized protein n=1 Tax=Polychaeton citri CBS 116435 TaxID=1314669 RepID=A0A9P4Q6A8_9PEZI|nr:hypothetical protein K431DRAFT_121186 [Polychaeton citri CBS 116435]
MLRRHDSSWRDTLDSLLARTPPPKRSSSTDSSHSCQLCVSAFRRANDRPTDRLSRVSRGGSYVGAYCLGDHPPPLPSSVAFFFFPPAGPLATQVPQHCLITAAPAEASSRRQHRHLVAVHACPLQPNLRDCNGDACELSGANLPSTVFFSKVANFVFSSFHHLLHTHLFFL